jgi:serine O-acetyltransferase
LPDSEAEVIRALVDRIESLEQQVQTLQQSQPALVSVLAALGALEHTSDATVHVASSCQLKDKTIQQFLDGTGI